MVNGVTGGGNPPKGATGTNKYGQPHYGSQNDFQNAGKSGGITYGSSYTDSTGTNRYADGMCGGPKGDWFVTTHPENEFDYACQEFGDSIYIGCGMIPGSNTVTGEYFLAPQNKQQADKIEKAQGRY